MSSFKVHHSGERASRCSPVGGIFISKIVDARHIATNTLFDKDSSVESERVAVLRIKVTW